MAIKSLCDIAVAGDEAAMTFVSNRAEAALSGETAAGANWAREILGLYLRNSSSGKTRPVSIARTM